MTVVTVYTTGPGCYQCKLTKTRLAAADVTFEEINIREVDAAREYVVDDLGYQQAPVVVVNDGTGQDHWSGFDPDQIDRIAAAVHRRKATAEAARIAEGDAREYHRE